jgi:hypothetical protein
VVAAAAHRAGSDDDPDTEEASMGLLSKLTKAGVAKQVVDEARKPENQRKIKDAIAKVTDKGKDGRSGTGRA